MTHLLVAVVLAAAYPPAPVVPETPAGLPPTIQVAKVDGERLLFEQTLMIPVTETRIVAVQEGDKVVQKPITVTVYKTAKRMTEVPLQDVKAFDTANKPIAKEKLIERLKALTPVVVSTDGQPIGEAYRKLLKDDVVLLILPAPNQTDAKPIPPPPPPNRIPPPPPKPDVKKDEAAVPAVEVALSAVARADEPKGKEVKFESHKGYFESNKSGLKGDASFLSFTDTKTFDDVFQKARTMAAKPNWLEDKAFDSKVVIATIQRGKQVVEYKVDKVTADGDVLYLSYTSMAKGAPGNATFNSPLIVSVDKGKYKSVVFIDNGKKVGTAEFGK